MTTIIPLKLSISNAFLLRGQKDILVDAGNPLDLPLLTRRLHQWGVDIGALSLIILTHVHFDHCGTLAALKKQTKCPVMVHQLEKEYLELGRNAPIIPIHPLGKAFMPFMDARFSPAAPDLLVDDALDLSTYGVSAQVIFTPGHTPGSVSILTDDRQAIVGDLCGGGWPLGQFQPHKPRYHYWASSLNDIQTSLKRILSFQPVKIHVGHGGPLDGRAAAEFFLVA
ncbi:MAG TPA: MBL fold metallo-hydrolase [Anaerolineaceae bacterium]|nr:MBL fold metallo-hydrolase [Anaerolineaceae bacterium]